MAEKWHLTSFTTYVHDFFPLRFTFDMKREKNLGCTMYYRELQHSTILWLSLLLLLLLVVCPMNSFFLSPPFTNNYTISINFYALTDSVNDNWKLNEKLNHVLRIEFAFSYVGQTDPIAVEIYADDQRERVCASHC